MPAPDDLALLIEASREAGQIALRYWRTDQKVYHKDDGAGPVSEGDLAVDAFLRRSLIAARPDYGWLSEETEDDLTRLKADRVFVVDPIDGTRAYVDGQTTWAISAAVVECGRPSAGIVYLPERGKLYAAAQGAGATLNDSPIHTGTTADPDAAEILTNKATVHPRHWRDGVPTMKRAFRPSLAYRMCLVAEGRYDAMLTLRPAWEWDIAAGALIAAEAGARVTGRAGAPLSFNRAPPLADGTIVAPPALHAAILDRLAPLPA